MYRDIHYERDLEESRKTIADENVLGVSEQSVKTRRRGKKCLADRAYFVGLAATV